MEIIDGVNFQKLFHCLRSPTYAVQFFASYLQYPCPSIEINLHCYCHLAHFDIVVHFDLQSLKALLFDHFNAQILTSSTTISDFEAGQFSYLSHQRFSEPFLIMWLIFIDFH